MKRTITLLTLFSIIASAQTEVGLKIGLNSTGQTIKEYGPGVSTGVDMYYMANAKSITALCGGLYAEFKRNKNFSLQPELIFKGGGYKQEFDYGNGYKYTQKYRLYYIDIPLLLKYNLFNTEKFGAFLLGGPYVGFLVTGRQIHIQGSDKEYDTFSVLDEIRKKYEVGAVISAGAKIKTRLGRFSLELRGVKSFTNIYKPVYDYSAKGGTYSIGLQLSYIYTLEEFFGPRMK